MMTRRKMSGSAIHGAGASAPSALDATTDAPEAPAWSDTSREHLRDRVRGRLFGDDARPPETIGRFAVTDRLGAGGMSVVYAAWDAELERPVAIKLLHTQGDRARLQREAKAMAKLAHPNVAAIYDVGTHEGEVYVAMEYVAGQTLGRWSAARSREQILEAYIQAGRGLQAAHEAGVIHRDFKPDNAIVGLVGEEAVGRVRVLDFGLAKAATETNDDATASGADRADLALTRTGAMLGTPRYMAPEQFESKPATPASDQFAFCVALYEALSKKRPYDGRSLVELAHRVIHDEPRQPSTDEIPPTLWTILRRGLSRAPADRHPSMAALCDALEAWQGEQRTESTPRWRRSAMAIGGALVFGGIAVWVQAQPTRNPPEPPSRHGSLTQSEVNAVKSRHEPAFEACQARARIRTIGLHGRITLELLVGPQGNVQSTQARETSLFDLTGKGVADPKLTDCLLRETRGWRFPPPKGGGSVKVSFPVVVDPKGPVPPKPPPPPRR